MQTNCEIDSGAPITAANALVCLMTSHNSFDVGASVCSPIKETPMAQWHEIHMPISHITFVKLHQLSIEVIWLAFHLELDIVDTETVCWGYAWGVILVWGLHSLRVTSKCVWDHQLDQAVLKTELLFIRQSQLDENWDVSKKGVFCTNLHQQFTFHDYRKKGTHQSRSGWATLHTMINLHLNFQPSVLIVHFRVR